MFWILYNFFISHILM